MKQAANKQIQRTQKAAPLIWVRSTPKYKLITTSILAHFRLLHFRALQTLGIFMFL